MKTLYLTDGLGMILDVENNTVDKMRNEREGVNRIYLAKEPMHVVYGSGEYTRELDVKKDDIIITFYKNSDTPHEIVVAKSKDWAYNIKKYEEARQKEAEEWAKRKVECDNEKGGGCSIARNHKHI